MLQRGVESFQGNKDPITAVAAAPHMLLIGRSSGDVFVYTLPELVPAGNPTTSNPDSLPLPLAWTTAPPVPLPIQLSSPYASCPYGLQGMSWIS